MPDLASPIPGARTVPNAQHAYRQGKLLARNIIATLRGREPKPCVHHSLGAIATLAFMAAGRTVTSAARPIQDQPANGLASIVQTFPAAGKVPEIR
ncbi:hypothetical protein [Amycolatopsis sp. CA-126428]|uniref:hypothetical protein n=1 Tax=Amycolatopsis sp. CA-126428 TaxID=2073158 RepID=UPI0018EA37F1|nr:hypothetical protein [Amycolatopsis sp. CA-126428]